ncbi:hypothetical protein D3C87_1550390 [compost metagenome]
MVLGHLVQAGQVLGDAVLEPEATPEIAVGAVDQKQPGLVINQQVAPLQIVMSEAMIMHGPGVGGQLSTDGVDPGAVRQLRIMPFGQDG